MFIKFYNDIETNLRNLYELNIVEKTCVYLTSYYGSSGNDLYRGNVPS